MSPVVESRSPATLSSTYPVFKKFPHDDQGPQLNFTIWLLAILSFCFLALRIYCKFLRGRGLWWDDHVLVAAWVRLKQYLRPRGPSVSR